VRPILEYGAVCWNPYNGGQVGALDRLQKRATKFANTNQTGWGILVEPTMVARLCALYKAYTGGRAWKAIGDRLSRSCYLSREHHKRKIGTRKQRTDIGKYAFLSRTIINWNKLTADLLSSFPCNLNTFRKRLKEVITNK
jgi:hypothetical protein